MRIYYAIIILFFKTFQVEAQQSFQEDFSTKFAFEVNSIDDFFDRFNFKKSSAFSKYLELKYPNVTINRKNLILSLFNRGNTDHNIEEIIKFINYVTDTIHPQFLKYSDKEWYAEITCNILHLGKPDVVAIILKVVKYENNCYSWDIVSAKADFLKFRHTKSDSLILYSMHQDNHRDSIHFLSPVSHGLDFSNMDHIFTNKSFINSYIYPGPQSFELNKLVYKIQHNEIQFKEVGKIRYHLLQIDGWIMILDYFSRNNIDSGWLINRLISVSPKEKNEYKQSKLKIQIQ